MPVFESLTKKKTHIFLPAFHNRRRVLSKMRGTAKKIRWKLFLLRSSPLFIALSVSVLLLHTKDFRTGRTSYLQPDTDSCSAAQPHPSQPARQYSGKEKKKITFRNDNNPGIPPQCALLPPRGKMASSPCRNSSYL